MKLFGEYLVEKKIVTADALAKALVQQIKSLPSLVEIVYEQQWMKPMDLIMVLKTQHRNHASFLETEIKSANLINIIKINPRPNPYL